MECARCDDNVLHKKSHRLKCHLQLAPARARTQCVSLRAHLFLRGIFVAMASIGPSFSASRVLQFGALSQAEQDAFTRFFCNQHVQVSLPAGTRAKYVPR